MTTGRRAASILAALALAATGAYLVGFTRSERGCSGSGCSPKSSAPTSSTLGTSTTTVSPGQFELTQFATLDEPVAVSRIPGSTSLAFAEKKGRVVVVDKGGATRVALDIRGQVATGNEQGLLGLAINPGGDRLYLDLTNSAGDTEIREYRWEANTAAPNGQKLLLTIDQPQSNHNGGQVAFGPDGFLYVGMGDGGGAGDPDGNGQRRDTLLGKLLRIDPRGDGTYAIPPSNPFVGQKGARPEIWAVGLRNPWRFTWHAGDLWIADVGQGDWEEINRVRATKPGVNYGWDRLEGTHAFEGTPPANSTLPVFEYSHSNGRCSVTGGDFIDDSYVFADFCDGKLLLLQGDPARSIDLAVSVDQPTSFGLDADGRLLVLSRTGAVHRLTRRDRQ